MTSFTSHAPIRGWLLVFVIVVLAGLVWTTVRAVRAVRLLSLAHVGLTPLGTTVRAFVSIRLGMGVLLAAAAVVGLSLLFRRDRRTRLYWLWYFPLLVLLSAVYEVLWVVETRAFASGGHPIPLYPQAVVGRLIGAVVGGAIWWAYWFRSQRVRQTLRLASAPPASPDGV